MCVWHTQQLIQILDIAMKIILRFLQIVWDFLKDIRQYDQVGSGQVSLRMSYAFSLIVLHCFIGLDGESSPYLV